MNALFSERAADGEVIDALVRANRRKSSIIESLEEQLKRRNTIMFIKSTEGKFYRVEAEQEVSADEVQACLDHCQAEAAALQALVAPAAPAAPADPPAEQPALPEPPTQPEQSAPAADPNAAQPEQPAASTEPVTVPADPNAVPPLQ